MKFHFRAAAKVCSVAIMILLVIGALGPANWTPRTALGWQIDHFLGYFAITLLVCLAWPRPFVVGGVLVAAAFLLEGLQTWLAVRPFHWLFRNHVLCLCGLAPAIRGRRSLRGSRGAARGPASLYTGSVSLSSGHILRPQRGRWLRRSMVRFVVRVSRFRLNSEVNMRDARSKSLAFTGSPNPV
jgi:hypothetical protein